MPVENISVEIDPDLVSRVAQVPEALICVAGLAYLTANIIEAHQFPTFKTSLTMRLYDFFDSANRLQTIACYKNVDEAKRAVETSKLWVGLGWELWEELQVVYWSGSHSKVSIKRNKLANSFTFNMAPWSKK